MDDDYDGLKGLAAIEDFAVKRSPASQTSVGQGGLDWAAIKRVYLSSAYIAQFMDQHGLTDLMESHLSSSE
jgi:hypothetical protein